MLAILLMAGGQLMHAAEELARTADHLHCTHEAADHDECPVDAQCCHLHVTGATVTSVKIHQQVVPSLSHYLPLLDETCLDGPRWDIDYPPQLS